MLFFFKGWKEILSSTRLMGAVEMKSKLTKLLLGEAI